MADKNMDMPVNGSGSDSDDNELAALREAALRSKRMRVEERKPVETVLELAAASQPVEPLVGPCPFDRRQLPHQPFGYRGQMRLPKAGAQNFIRSARSNLIVIQTVPLEEDKPVAPPPLPKLEVHTSQEKSVIVRPQDRWAPSNDVKQHGSPAKPKVPTKFDRYDSSGSESEEDLSSHEGSESDDSVSHEKTHEPQPSSEQLQSDSAFTETNADLPASDASSLNSLTNSSKLLLDSPRNSPTSEQVLENQSNKRSSSKSIPSTENSPHNLHSLVPQSTSLSPISSKSICSQSAEEITQSATLRADSKSPVNLKSQSGSRSSSRSCSPVNSRLSEPRQHPCVSAASASPTPPRSRSKSPVHMLADWVKSPSYQKSPVRSRSPARLRSPMHLMSKADSKSPVNFPVLMRSRSKSRSRSRSRSESKSRSPISMRSLSSRSKASSGSPVHSRLKSHSRSPQKLSPHVRKRSGTRSRSPVNSKSRLYSGLRASSRSPLYKSSRVRLRSRTRSRSPASRRSEVPLTSRTRSKSPPSLLSSKLYRDPSNPRSPRFSRSPVYRRSPGHSKSPVLSRSHEHLRSNILRRLPLVSRSPGQLKQKTVSKFPVESRSSEHAQSPVRTKLMRISRSPDRSSSHSTSPKISRSPGCYRPHAHSGSPRNSRSPRRYRSPGWSKHTESTRSSRHYRSLERSLSPKQVRSRTHSRSPRIPRSPVDVNSSKLSLLYSQSGMKSRSRAPGSRSPAYSRSSSPGNGSYRLTSKMVKCPNGSFDPRQQPGKRAPREEGRLHRHSSMRLEADRIASKSTAYQHSSHNSAGAGYRPVMVTGKPEGELNNITAACNWIDRETRSHIKRISPDKRNEKSAELRKHNSGYVKDQRSLPNADVSTRTERSANLKQHRSDYDQVLEMRKRKFDNVGLLPAEAKTLLLRSGRLKSRSFNSIDREKIDNNVLRRDGDNYEKCDDQNESRIRNRNDHKPNRIQSRLDQKLDGLHHKDRTELKMSESKTHGSGIQRHRTGSRGFSVQKSCTAFSKAAEKSSEADECDSETASGESSALSDADARLSQLRPSLSDDSDSETEASGPREKHFTERNDLPTTNPVLKLAGGDKYRRQGFQRGTVRQPGRRQNIVSREAAGMRQSYIQPLMEGLQFGKLRSRSPSPNRLHRSPSRSPAAKRARNDSPRPLKSVLSVVKLAKNASSTDASLCTERKRSDQSGEKVSLVKLHTVKQSSDEDKPNVMEVENSAGSSDIRKDARSIVQKMDDKGEAGTAPPSSDQRTIQITFNQKMEFDESVKLPSRRSVHQRLGKLEIGARKDKTVETSSHQVVAEEKKIVDLRHLIGEKSRHIVYRVDSPDAEEPEEMDDEAGAAAAADELFQKRKKPRRRRKLNPDNLGAGSGKLEGRHTGRSTYS